MNDPDRLLESDQSALVRTLISAAREERPTDRAVSRTLLAVAAGSAVIGATTTAGGASALGASGTSLGAILKWLGIGATAGLVTAGTAVKLESRSVPRESTAVVAPAPVAPAQRPPERGPVSAVDLPSEEPAPPVAQKSAPPPPARAPEVELVEDDPSLNAEVLVLDRARKALAGGDAKAALAELGSYDREFPGGRLGPEALFLRMEASVQKGERAPAERAARELVSKYPKSPHAARARAVLSGGVSIP